MRGADLGGVLDPQAPQADGPGEGVGHRVKPVADAVDLAHACAGQSVHQVFCDGACHNKCPV